MRKSWGGKILQSGSGSVLNTSKNGTRGHVMSLKTFFGSSGVHLATATNLPVFLTLGPAVFQLGHLAMPIDPKEKHGPP